MKNNRINENFVNEDPTDDDMLAMRIYLTPEHNIKLEIGVILDEDGEELPERKAMENTLTILRTALFTLSEEYIRKFGDELKNEDPSFFDQARN